MIDDFRQPEPENFQGKRTMTMNFGTTESINAVARWPVDGERASFEIEPTFRNDPFSHGSLAETIQRELAEEQAPASRDFSPKLPSAAPRGGREGGGGGGGGMELGSTVEKVLKSKQVQDAIRTSARKAAAEALESLMRSIANIEQKLSSRITTLEEAMVTLQSKQKEGNNAKPTNAKPTKNTDPRYQVPQVPPGHGSDLWAVLDANRHALSGQHQARVDASSPPGRGGGGRIAPKNFASDPHGSKQQQQPERLDPKNFGSDPRGRQLPPQQAQPAPQTGTQQRLNSVDFNSAPARTGPPGASSNQKPVTIREIEAYQLERLLMESAMDTIREGKQASKRPSGGAPSQPPDQQGQPKQGQPSASSNGFAVIPGSMASSSTPLPPPSGPSGPSAQSGRGREPGTSYPQHPDNDGGNELTSNTSPGSSDAETNSNSKKKKSNGIRQFFGKQLGWNRSSTQ